MYQDSQDEQYLIYSVFKDFIISLAVFIPQQEIALEARMPEFGWVECAPIVQPRQNMKYEFVMGQYELLQW